MLSQFYVFGRAVVYLDSREGGGTNQSENSILVLCSVLTNQRSVFWSCDLSRPIRVSKDGARWQSRTAEARLRSSSCAGTWPGSTGDRH